MYPLPANEQERLNALNSYNILDTEAEQEFDDIVLLAAQICDAPIALISLVDAKRQWFKAKFGIETEETARDISFCTHAIMQQSVFKVSDALRDERFMRSPLVTSDPKIRFYAGAPLTTSGGHGLGVLCVIDRQPRELTPQQEAALAALGRQVMSHLELRMALAHNKRIEEELRTSEQRFRHATRGWSAGVWEHDLESSSTIISEGLRDLLGYSADDADSVPRSLQSLIHPHDAATESEAIGDLIRNNTPYDVEIRMRVKSGEYRWFRSRCVVLRNESDGSPQKLVGALHDVSDRKHFEEALRESEELFHTLSDYAPIGIFRTDALGRYIYTNPHWRTITGLSLEQSLGGGWSKGIHPEDSHKVLESWRLCTTNRREFSTDYRLRSQHGEIHWVRSRAIRILSPDGKVSGYVGTLEDITQHKLAEEALRENEQRFRNMIDSAPAFMYLLGTTMECTHINKTAQEFTGRTLEQELGSGWIQAVHPDDVEHCTSAFRNAFLTRQRVSAEYRTRRHDGEYRWILDVAVPRYAPNGEFIGYIGSCFDITDRKRAEENERKALKNLHHEQLKVIEHERQLEQQRTQINTLREVTLTLMDKINNPLAIMLMTFEVWQRNHALPNDVARSIETLRQSAFRISESLQEVMNLNHYKTLDLTFGKVLDIYSDKKGQLISEG